MKQKTVAIFGGGVGGMSAAHMLALRGFQVTVYERAEVYVGGKARSVDVPGTNMPDKDKYLPGEHGFRFFPGFYSHVIETMKEIPFDDKKTAYDSLVSTETIQINQIDAPPIKLPLHFPKSLKDVHTLFEAVEQASEELTKKEAEFFGERVWQLMTSCKGRFLSKYEETGWWAYTKADDYSEAYQRLLVDGLTRSLVASKAKMASTRTVGTMFLQLLYTMIDNNPGNTDRVLNLPTNDAWLTPWSKYLESIGVVYRKGHELVEIQMESGAAGASVSGGIVRDVKTGKNLPPVTADYYIMAMPVEVAAKIIEASPLMTQAAPALENVIKLSPNVEWMNGIQYFLTEDFSQHRGHTVYSGANYALTSISQKQFWPNYDLEERFCGKAKGIFSVDISDWEKPGNFNNKPAKDCTKEEVIHECWRQLKDEINVDGKEPLKDEMLVFAYLDESIYQPFSHPLAQSVLESLDVIRGEKETIQELKNKEPLLVNVINTWKLRPEAKTGIPNLFLAADYVRTYTDLATMEGANEAARRASNAILDAAGSSESRLGVWPYTSPWQLRFFQAIDWVRWKLGRPWSTFWPF